MLQQTQVVTVVPYFDRFMARFPDLRSLAEAPLEAVIEAWAGLGYYSRARNLHRAAGLVHLGRFGAPGRFPSTREEWLEMPGVGPYTAGAILSISADLPVPILDGNVERVLSRIRRVGREKGEAPYKKRLWRLAGVFVRDSNALRIRPSVLNQALMELGATTCTPRNPHCERCPLAAICRAKERGEVEAFPPKKPRKQWKEVRETVQAWVTDEGQVLLRQRTPGEWRAGLWDFPEELPKLPAGLKLEGSLVGEVLSRHIVTNHRIFRTTRVFQLPLSSTNGGKQAVLNGLPGFCWVSLEDPARAGAREGVAVGSAFRKTLKEVLALLSRTRFGSGKGGAQDAGGPGGPGGKVL